MAASESKLALATAGYATALTELVANSRTLLAEQVGLACVVVGVFVGVRVGGGGASRMLLLKRRAARRRQLEPVRVPAGSAWPRCAHTAAATAVAVVD